MVKRIPQNEEMWDGAVITSHIFRNRIFTSSGNNGYMKPLEAFRRRIPDLSSLLVLAAKVVFHVLKENEKESCLIEHLMRH